jgi:membrane-associated phospholipid phosphatase
MRARRLRLAAVLTAAAFLVGTGWFVTRGSVDPDRAAAGWRPLLLPSARAVRVGPPGDEARELDTLARLRERLSDAQRRAVERWSNPRYTTIWTHLALERIGNHKLNPLRAARVLVLVNAAIYDAMIASWDARIAYGRPAPSTGLLGAAPLLPRDTVSSYPSSHAAVAAAAAGVLIHLFPADKDVLARERDEAIATRLWAGTNRQSDVDAGRMIGEAVAAIANSRADGDGSAAKWTGTVPVAPGSWVARDGRPGIEPLAGTWKTWFMQSGDQFRPAAPPAFGSPEWQRAADEVVEVKASLTQEQLDTAWYWATGPQSSTPAGHWEIIAMDLAEHHGLSAATTARMLAYLGAAQADAVTSCWDAKYTYWTGRPDQLIPGFIASMPTPYFPSFPSGHAVVSAASAAVIAEFVPAEREHVLGLAEEAAMSRLLAGIHYRFDNETGLDMGRQIGALIVDRLRSDTELR